MTKHEINFKEYINSGVSNLYIRYADIFYKTLMGECGYFVARLGISNHPIFEDKSE